MLFPFLSCQEGDKEYYQGIKSPFFVHTEVFCLRCLLHYIRCKLRYDRHQAPKKHSVYCFVEREWNDMIEILKELNLETLAAVFRRERIVPSTVESMSENNSVLVCQSSLFCETARVEHRHELNSGMSSIAA